MADMLENKRSMFYIKREGTPWHFGGICLDDCATFAEVCEKLMQFRSTYSTSPLLAFVDGRPQPVPDMVAIIRDEDKKVLGAAGDGYQLVGPDVMGATIDSILGETGAHYNTGGSLYGGSLLWLQAILPDRMRIKGDESEHEKYLLIGNGLTGRATVTLQGTATRVVCANTYTQAVKGAKDNGFRIKHTKNCLSRIEGAAEALKATFGFFKVFEDTCNRLAETRYTDIQMSELARVLMPAKDESEVPTRTQNSRDALCGLFSGGTGIGASIRGTGYAALNACTEYADHVRGSRVSAGQDSNEIKLASTWLGSGAAFKEQALEVICEQAGIPAFV